VQWLVLAKAKQEATIRDENGITILNKNRINAILKVFKRIFHVPQCPESTSCAKTSY
jgi:hypothetical protein